MTRQPTPNVLDELMPTQSEATAIRESLRWDYSQLGPAAGTIIGHTIQIKRNERKANEAAIESGRHLIAVKDALSHGQWTDWLSVEFSMSARTARTLMSIAERFDGKTEIISDLSVTVLGMLAAPSTPEPARAKVINEAQTNGRSPSVQRTREIIAEHKPQPSTPKQFAAAVRAATWGERTVVDVLPPSDAPLPAWAQEKAAAHTDERLPAAQRLRGLYQAVIDSEDEYGNLTGDFSGTLAVKRELKKMIDHLDWLINAIQHPEVTA